MKIQQIQANPNRVILTDCDGVLLNWEFAFDCWMEDKGFKRIRKDEYDICIRYGITKPEASKFIKDFNESAAIGFLPPLRDAMYYVKRLHEEHGFVFHCITSLSLDPNAKKLREMNLNKLFGDTAFEKVVCLDTGADKDDALEPYKNTRCWWVEDKPENAETGYNMGLRSILMEHGHNMYHYHKEIPIVKNWKEAFELITTALV